MYPELNQRCKEIDLALGQSHETHLWSTLDTYPPMITCARCKCDVEDEAARKPCKG